LHLYVLESRSLHPVIGGCSSETQICIIDIKVHFETRFSSGLFETAPSPEHKEKIVVRNRATKKNIGLEIG